MSKRFGGVLVGLVLVGCSPSSRAPVPTPTPVSDAPASAQPTDPLPPPPDLGLPQQLVDTALLHRILGDSIQDRKDMELLETLHDTTASTTSDSLSNSAEVDLAEMFDINVARYAEHERVRFYLDFFKSRARDRMAIWLERLPVYEPMIREALAANNLPRDLIYLALIESGYSNTAVSRSKAVGMWQFMRPTARDYGMRVDHWVDERRDPIKATKAAARYLADLTKRFGGSSYLAAAAYNGGGGTVSRGLRKLGAGADEDYIEEDEADGEIALDPTGDDRFFHLSESRYLRKETKDYVPKLIAAAMIAKQPEKYGFAPIPVVDPFAVDSVPVTEPTGLEAVARATGLDGPSLAALNPHLLRGITPPSVGTAWIRVPAGYGTRATEAVAALTPAERIPGATHVVRKKETLRAIGKRYGLSASELAQFNPHVNAAAPLPAGTSLHIPGLAKLRSYAAEDQRDDAASKARSRTRGLHTVRSGETVTSIARRYKMTAAQLRAMNELSSRAALKVGQRLRVLGGRANAKPAASPRTATPKRTRTATAAAATVHVVRRGDTLSSLARRYGVSVEALKNRNGLRASTSLKAGSKLTIPS